MSGTVPVLMFDSEVYRNYYLAAFRNIETGAVRFFEKHDDCELDAETIRQILRSYRVVTFNGESYDIPIVTLALNGRSTEEIKRGSDAIIKNNLRSWQFYKEMGVRRPTSIDHVDLIEIPAGKMSLKAYGGRLHAPKLQDLPIEPDALILPEQRQLMREYCGNDLQLTERLYRYLLPQIQLREQMGRVYDEDLRSKSDAQIAEVVISKEVSAVLGHEVKKPRAESGSFRYTRPAFIQFETAPLQELARQIDTTDFIVPDSGYVQIPKELSARKIVIGKGVYRMGIGGLHSSEKRISHKAVDGVRLIDRDVAGYYPAIILKTGLKPPHMGDAFTRSYQKIVDTRLAAKRAGNKTTADTLKIVVNGSFGKHGSKYSKLYAPNLLIQTTVTGQLALLMLIESLEGMGVPIVSANTDGVLIKCPPDKIETMDFCIWLWEQQTGFETEATEYDAVYSRDVNNYIALKKGGGAKLKGAYAPPVMVASSWPAPSNEICTTAVVKYLTDGTPIEQTIAGCEDVRQFVSIQKVTGGAMYAGTYLGRVVRWYYSIASAGAIHYKVNGNKVASTDGAMPLMELPESLPGDVDHDWYINEARSILKQVGAA